MAGNWEAQNKTLPGIYLNFKTDEPLSIQISDRGCVLLLQEMQSGAKGDMYTVTPLTDGYPEGTAEEEKLLPGEILKNAKKVKIYNLGTNHTADDVTAALAAIKTEDFDTLCYPYYTAGTSEAIQQSIASWVKAQVETEGMGITAVMANFKADSELIINVAQGVKLANGALLTAAQTTAWVAGATAGAGINQSNTYKKYTGAVDVVPRMTKTEMEKAVENGEFIFKTDRSQNVSALYDINSLTTFTVSKSEKMRKNRLVRLISGIRKDIGVIYESNCVGKYDNNVDGKNLLKADLVEYFNTLLSMRAIQNFTPEDVTVADGAESDAVVISVAVKPVDSIEKIYITVKL